MALIPKLDGAWSCCLGLLLALSGCQLIMGKTAGPSSDLSISNAVQVKLMNDPHSGFPRIGVDTVRGVVTLSGIVATVAQQNRAEWLARQVDGVVKVENGVQIQPHSLPGIGLQADQLGDPQPEGSQKTRVQTDHQAPSTQIIYGGLIIQGDVVRVENGQYFVKQKDGKEVRLKTDSTTQMGRIKKGDHIVSTVDEETHALSIHSIP